MTLVAVWYRPEHNDIYAIADSRLTGASGPLTDQAPKFTTARVQCFTDDSKNQFGKKVLDREIAIGYAGSSSVAFATIATFQAYVSTLVLKQGNTPTLAQIGDLARRILDKNFREFGKLWANEARCDLLIFGYLPVDNELKCFHISTIFGFYIPFLAENLKVFENLGEGMFRNIPLEEEVAEADSVATGIDTNDPGIIYVYSFPSIQKNGKYPIKVGLTTTGDAETRVAQQCRQACCFEHPVILKSWSVQRVAAVEMAIHRTLEARGSKRLAPGNEWFNTTLEEVESILNFIKAG